MSIADLLKYAEFLTGRLNELKNISSKLQLTKVGTRVVGTAPSGAVIEEQTEYTLNPKAVLSEYDATAKELRLVRQTVERLNHTTVVEFTQAF